MPPNSEPPIPNGWYKGFIRYGQYVESCDRHKLAVQLDVTKDRVGYKDKQYTDAQMATLLRRCGTHNLNELRKRKELSFLIEDNELKDIHLREEPE